MFISLLSISKISQKGVNVVYCLKNGVVGHGPKTNRLHLVQIPISIQNRI